MSNGIQKSHLIEIKVRARSELDRPKLARALSAIGQNDPNLFIELDSEMGEALVGGISELHLDGILMRLEEQGIAANVGAPKIAYRETITRRASTDYTHKRFVSGVAAYARVVLEIEPNIRDAGNSYEQRPSNVPLSKDFIKGIEKGVNSVLEIGPILGFPIVDLKAVLIDAAYHDTDSSVLAFEVAARSAMRQAMDSAGPALLEPVMKTEVTSPPQFLGSIIGDLNSRRGQVVAVTENGQMNTVNALVPLAKMFGYQVNLLALSAGCATYAMTLSHYQILPPTDPDNFRPAVGMRI